MKHAIMLVAALLLAPLTDIPNPRIYLNGAPAPATKVRRTETGSIEIALKKGETVTFTPVALEKADLKIEPIPVSEADRNLFGLSKKAERLPGHAYYYRN